MITLTEGIISRKEIFYEPKKDKFYITNWIDDSYQTLNSKQLMLKSYTNIGYAIKKKALILNLLQI